MKNYQHSFAVMPDGRSLWSVIVTDEAQEYKTPNSKVSHAIKALHAKFHVASTGTPVENRLLDLWNLVDTLQPALLGSATEFSRQYEDGRGSTEPLKDLRQRLLFGQPNAFLLRREKAGTLGLPPRHEHRLSCDMTAREVALHREIVGSVDASGKATSMLGALQRLALLYQHPGLLEQRIVDDPSAWASEAGKLRRVVEELRTIRGRGEKAIIFARHVAAQQMLAAVLEPEFDVPVRIINGGTPSGSQARAAATRKGILEEFRCTPGFALLVLSPFVAGVGLTIVEANHVFHYGRWWNPAVENQATDRVYRLGQERDVHVYLPILRDPRGQLERSFDKALDDLIEAKRALARDFLAPVETEGETASQLFSSLAVGGDGGGDPVLDADLGRLREEELVHLVASLLRHEGAQVERPGQGQAPGATLLATTASAVTPLRVLPPTRACSAADVAAAAGSRAQLTDAGRSTTKPEVWSLGDISPDARSEATAKSVRLVGRPEIAGRLIRSPVPRRELWRE